LQQDLGQYFAAANTEKVLVEKIARR